MKTFTPNEIKRNYAMPPIEVKHSDLKRFGDSLYKSECPKCKDGLLLVGRNSKTLKLEARDVCVNCGRRFIYADIKKMRLQLDGDKK